MRERTAPGDMYADRGEKKKRKEIQMRILAERPKGWSEAGNRFNTIATAIRT